MWGGGVGTCGTKGAVGQDTRNQGIPLHDIISIAFGVPHVQTYWRSMSARSFVCGGKYNFFIFLSKTLLH